MKNRNRWNQNQQSKKMADPPLEWRGDERSEESRNGGGGSGENSPVISVPNPEVPEKPQRRKFSAAFKTRIVQEADACSNRGQIGALLRREGLYSSQLTQWRRKFQQGAQQALADDKRGRKPLQSELARENQRLQKQVERLEKRLHQAETIIEVQKKISDLLGIQQPPLPKREDD